MKAEIVEDVDGCCNVNWIPARLFDCIDVLSCIFGHTRRQSR